MRPRREIDPELHLLRSIARSAKGSARLRREIESARFQIYNAFESRDADAARRWLRALRVAIQSADLGGQEADALAAIAEIEKAIDG